MCMRLSILLSAWLGLFGAGVYGGFVQAGVGFVLLAVLGVTLAIPMKRNMINQERLKFPSGLAAALALLVAWACDVFLTPLLAARIRFVTLWDTLRLDLGREPQQQIPLLAGLSKRQARTFALLTELQERPAGDVIMQAGQHSDDCFVVIDGELAVTRDRADRAWHVATLGRGALVGEVGLFQQARTATVVAQTPVRLIRFSTHDLRQLVRQAPRIAAVVLFNLNTIQAERRSHDSREYLGLTPVE